MYAFLLSILLSLLGICAVVCVRLYLAARPRSTRGLYRFHNGRRWQEVDPISVLNTLDSHPQFRFDLHPKRAAMGESEALQIVADAVRSAFSVAEYTSPRKAGLTIRECHELLCDFFLWCDVQKKTTELTPTSAQSTGATSEGSGETTTRGMSDSL